MKPIDKMRWEKFMGTVEQKIAEKWVESVERKVPHHLK